MFIIGQADYKRMLAYSSVEHMGILALGVGIGGAAGFGAMLHAVNHSVTKAMLFFVAGNILAAYKTQEYRRTCAGVLRVLPISGVLWLAGFLAITGSPPFGTFLSDSPSSRQPSTQGTWPRPSRVPSCSLAVDLHRHGRRGDLRWRRANRGLSDRRRLCNTA